MELRTARAGSPPPAGVLITATAVAALAAVAAGLPSAISAVQQRPADVVTFLALGLAFDLLAVEIHGKGMIGISAIAKLAAAFTLGPGVAMLIAATLAITHSTRPHSSTAASGFSVSVPVRVATVRMTPSRSATGTSRPRRCTSASSPVPVAPAAKVTTGTALSRARRQTACRCCT